MFAGTDVRLTLQFDYTKHEVAALAALASERNKQARKTIDRQIERLQEGRSAVFRLRSLLCRVFDEEFAAEAALEQGCWTDPAALFDKCLILMARLAGIEPTTLGFGGQYSIH